MNDKLVNLFPFPINEELKEKEVSKPVSPVFFY